MSEIGRLTNVSSNDQLGPAPERARPRAWAIFVDSGNARMWSTLQSQVQKLADAEGLEVTPLYDQAALDAAAADARDDLSAQIDALHTNLHITSTALTMAQADAQRLRNWLAGDAECPCCGESERCLDSCTFAVDASNDWDRMQWVRRVLAGA